MALLELTEIDESRFKVNSTSAEISGNNADTNQSADQQSDNTDDAPEKKKIVGGLKRMFKGKSEKDNS
jgi:hypothetical protein